MKKSERDWIKDKLSQYDWKRKERGVVERLNLPVDLLLELAVNIRTLWQDMDRTWTTVEKVYETRWDCFIGRSETAFC